MRVLLLYATNSGSTQATGEIITTELTKKGHQVAMKQVREGTPQDLETYEAIVLGSPTWDYEGLEGQVHEDYRPFMAKLTGKQLANKKFAVFALGDRSYSIFCGAADQLEKFVKDLGGTLVIDSLRINGFYFDQDNNTRLITEWAGKLSDALV